MEIPDKIYVSTNINGEVFDNSWFWHNLHHSDIEYIRTDTFIEKACKMINNINCHYIRYSVAGASFDSKQFIEDFKKAMNL